MILLLIPTINGIIDGNAKLISYGDLEQYSYMECIIYAININTEEVCEIK